MRKATEGVHGGIDLLDADDRKVDRDVEEATEPLNLRTADQLDNALAEVLKRPPGGHIVGFQRDVVHDGVTRPSSIRFDRFYWELNLLVMFYPEPLNEAKRAEVIKSRDEHELWAHENKHKFLAIIGGASLADIEEALN